MRTIIPIWWDRDEALSTLKTWDYGFRLSGPKDEDQVPRCSLSVEHRHGSTAHDEWTMTSLIRLGVGQSMTLILTLTTAELEQIFGPAERGENRSVPGKFNRHGAWVIVPNCGRSHDFDLNVSILISDEIIAALRSVRSRYGPPLVGSEATHG